MHTTHQLRSSCSTLLVGGIFLLSALLKLISINTFELYIFGLGGFTLDLSALLARGVIGAELCLGVGYLLLRHHRLFYRLIFASLVGFTLFLTYLVVIGNGDNCHCFGDLVELSPTQSILKNLALLLLLWLSKEPLLWHIPLPRWLYTLLLGVALLLPSLLAPHRTLYRLFTQEEVNEQFNHKLFREFMVEHPEYGWGERTKLVCFYGTQCKYCRYSAQQLSQIVRRNHLDSKGVALFFWGSEQRVAEFFEETKAVEFDYTILPPETLLRITQGRIPTLILFDGDDPQQYTLYKMNTLDEDEVVKQVSVSK